MPVKIYNKGDKEVSKRVCRGCVIVVAVERKKPDHAIETDQYLKLRILVNSDQQEYFETKTKIYFVPKILGIVSNDLF